METIIKLFIISLIFSSCKDDSVPIKPDPVIPYAQKEIEWPSLKKSPWPMYRHDPQLTGRSQFVGPTKGIIVDTIRTGGIASLSAISIDNDGTIYCSITGGDTNLVALSPQGTPIWGLILSLLKPFNTPTILSDNNIIHISQNGIRKISPSGSVVWTWQPPSPVFQYISPIDKSGNIYCIDNASTLYKISSNGIVVWSKSDSRFLWGGGSTPSFSPDGMTLYVSGFLENAPRLLAVDVNSGSVRWVFGEYGVSNAPVVDNHGNIYLLSPIKGNDTVAVLFSISPNGNIRWKQEFPARKYYHQSFINIDPTIDNAGNIYFVFQDTIRSFSNEGIFRWKKCIGEKVIITPLICDNNGSTYFGTSGAYTIANDILSYASDGTKRWEISINKMIQYLTLKDNKLVVTSYHGELFTIE